MVLGGLGDNLIENNSFEIDPSTFQITWIEEWKNSDMKIEWTNEKPKFGQYSMMIRASEAPLGNSGMYFSELIPVDGGEMYSYSIWATSPDGAGAIVTVDLYDNEKRYLHTSSTKCERMVPKEWRPVSIGILLAKDVAYARPGFQL